jgi:hypothetical protein
MKKLLVLASLGSLVLFYACGGGAPGEKAANAETAAAMSSATMTAIGPYILPTVDEDLPVCINLGQASLGTATLIETETSATSGTKAFTFTNCVSHVCLTCECDTDFVSLNGTLNIAYNATETTGTMTLNGAITFGAAPADLDQTIKDRFRLAGKACSVEVAITDMPLTADDPTDYISGYVCGYDWTEVVLLTDEEFCPVIDA